MSRKFLTGIDLAGQRATGAADGSAATDLVTKQQLDGAVRGLDWKGSVRAATTANITLSGTQTVDGVALAVGDEVLVKNQTTASGNGIYVVAAGAWTRRTDADVNAEVTSGLTVTVTEGTTKGTGTATAAPLAWTLSTPDPITVGTTALSFVAAASGGGTTYAAGNGLSLTGTTFAVVPGNGVLADGSSTRVDPSVVVRKVAATIGNGAATAIAVTHNLGTKDVTVSLRDAASDAAVDTDWVATDVNTVTFTFATAPATNAYRATIHG